MKDSKLYTHIVRIPRVFSKYPKEDYGGAIYRLFNEIGKLNQIKQASNQIEYQEQSKVRLKLEQKIQDVLEFLCKEESLTVQQVFSFALILDHQGLIADEIDSSSNKSNI